MSDKEFWDKDMTTVHDKHSWFTALSPQRKTIFCLILLFVAAWCFYLGFLVVEAQQPDYDDIIKLTAADISQEEEEAQILELTGSRVILVVGSDSRDGHNVNLSDTMMLVFMDMDDKQVDVISIPRDTYVAIPNYGNSKINAAFSTGGIDRAIDTVEYLTGIAIDNYVIVDFQGFVDCVDAIGGVEVEVDQRMYKPSENIDLSPGLQTLTGEQALAFVRYRDYTNGDLGRIEHQQYFIKQLAGQMLTLSNLTKVPELIGIAIDNLSTDLRLSDAISIATYMIQMDMTNLNMHTLPCEAKYMQYGGTWLSFVFVQQAQCTTLLKEISGGELDFTPHFLDDGGQGRYSIPSDEPEPTDTDPEEVPPMVTDPNATDPNATDPGVTDPNATDPNVTDPNATDPGVVDPGVVDPGVVDTNSGGTGDAWGFPDPDSQ